jgi:two-component system chemotaxis response regulator CheY
MADSKGSGNGENPHSDNPEKLDTIVVAEDSPPNRKILSHLLQKLGFHVVACEHGQEAKEALHSGKHHNIVAVISDVMMPKMDGIQLLRHVREDETLKDLPFVLVTAVSEKDYIVQARALNVNGYILKPVTFDRLTSKLRELFPARTFPKLSA